MQGSGGVIEELEHALGAQGISGLVGVVAQSRQARGKAVEILKARGFEVPETGSANYLLKFLSNLRANEE